MFKVVKQKLYTRTAFYGCGSIGRVVLAPRVKVWALSLCVQFLLLFLPDSPVGVDWRPTLRTLQIQSCIFMDLDMGFSKL